MSSLLPASQPSCLTCLVLKEALILRVGIYKTFRVSVFFDFCILGTFLYHLVLTLQYFSSNRFLNIKYCLLALLSQDSIILIAIRQPHLIIASPAKMQPTDD